MPLKPLFGTLNATVAKTIVQNAPKYRKIIEPFADGGTLALEVKKRKPKEHVVNIFDENLFAAMTFAQTYTSGQFRQVKGYDWVSSQETFDVVRKISAIEGPEHFYKFYYTKKFGMAMDPEAEPTWDLLSAGKDLKANLFALPLMRALLKGATITNDEPMSLVTGGDFLILLPKTPEDVQAVEGRLNGLGGNFFYAAKVPDAMAVVEAAKKHSNHTVTAISAPSIMMNKMSVIVNYESKLQPIDPDAGQGMADMGAQGMTRWKRVYRSQSDNGHYKLLLRESAARIVRKEVVAMSKAAKRCTDTESWEQAINEFYDDHTPYVARNLAVSQSIAEGYVQEQRAALSQYGAGVMENWETDAAERLLALVNGGHNGGSFG